MPPNNQNKSEILMEVNIPGNGRCSSPQTAGNIENTVKFSPTPGQKSTAIQTLGQLSAFKAVLKQITKELRTDKIRRQFKATQLLGQILRANNQLPIDMIVKAGVVRKCVEFLKNKAYEQLQFQAACVLRSLTEAGSKQTEIVVEAGAVDPLTTLLQSKYMFVVDTAVCTFVNIMAKRANLPKVAICNVIVPSLVALVNPSITPLILEHVACALANICRNYRECLSHNVIQLIIPACIELIRMTEGKTAAVACCALKALSCISSEMFVKISDQVVESAIAQNLVQLLDSADLCVLNLSAEVISIVICSGTRGHHFIDSGILPRLAKLLQSADSEIVFFAVCTVRNIAVEGDAQKSALVSAGFLPLLVDVVNTGVLKCQEQAVYTLKCIALENEDHCNYLYKAKAIPAMCNLLKCKDESVLSTTLDAIMVTLVEATKFGHMENVALAYEECGGLDLIEDLQNHDSHLVYKKSYDIIDKFFSE